MLAATRSGPAGLDGDAIGELRSALIAAVVAGELSGPVPPGRWRMLARRFDVPSAALRLATLELYDLGLLTIAESRVQISGEEFWRLFAPPVFRELNQPRGRAAIAAYMDARQWVDPSLCALAAERRSDDDGVALSQALRSVATIRGSWAQRHERVRRHRTRDDRLRAVIARAARNRFLAEASARLRRKARDADWASEQAAACPRAASLLDAVTEAILAGDATRSSLAARAEIDLFESWTWRRLAALSRSA